MGVLYALPHIHYPTSIIAPPSPHHNPSSLPPQDGNCYPTECGTVAKCKAKCESLKDKGCIGFVTAVAGPAQGECYMRKLAETDFGDCSRALQAGDTKSSGYQSWTANRSCAFTPGWTPSAHGGGNLPCLAFAITEKPLAIALTFAAAAPGKADVAQAQALVAKAEAAVRAEIASMAESVQKGGAKVSTTYKHHAPPRHAYYVQHTPSPYLTV